MKMPTEKSGLIIKMEEIIANLIIVNFSISAMVIE